MPRLSAIPGLVSASLAAAIGVWWLASVALQQDGGLTDVADLSAGTAAVVILAQWILIALLATQTPPAVDRQITPAVATPLAATMPLWPLLVVLWLTSRLSAVTLIASQLGAIALAAGMILLGHALTSQKKSGNELRQLLSAAAGIAIASMIWTARTPLMNWVSP